jgi:hypothetical protein
MIDRSNEKVNRLNEPGAGREGRGRKRWQKGRGEGEVVEMKRAGLAGELLSPLA